MQDTIILLLVFGGLMYFMHGRGGGCGGHSHGGHGKHGDHDPSEERPASVGEGSDEPGRKSLPGSNPRQLESTSEKPDVSNPV